MTMRTNNVLKYVLIILAVLLCVSATACDFDESGNKFHGGEILDENIIQSIKDALITTEQTTDISETESTQKDTGTTESTNTEESDDQSTQTETKHDTTEKSEENTVVTEAETKDNDSESDEQIVYWTKSGETWHTKEDCYHIKKSEYVSGTVEEAIEAGKKRVCKTCTK